MSETETLIDKYKQELEEDTKINLLNIKDVQMFLPSIKHKWASRLIQHKIELKKSHSLLKKAREKIFAKNSKGNPVKVSKATMMNKVDDNDVIVRIKDKIEEHEIIIEYLEKVERVFNSMTYDIKNLVEIMKLETL